MQTYTEILDFWFTTLTPKQWWTVDPELDKQLSERFGPLVQQASAGELFGWRATTRGRLAEIIVLDQFSRNIFRNTPAAFTQDNCALILTQEAVTAGALTELQVDERAFLLMPYMHSESRFIHQQAEILFREHTPKNNYDFELRHKAIIDRFGRYPHRNRILGRESTAEELAFLQEPGSGF
ncbi:DUF924 family protein [Halioxenophilus sp. WMMB6]|uniref:DUF924 family protein n=1 Tax=Halioxenophilus sp. WMMB6 TaxID=3073815 RepID=UPI00295E4EEB|nr:DUF924 family protein [Halioxenophilus sp. WMMB6]